MYKRFYIIATVIPWLILLQKILFKTRVGFLQKKGLSITDGQYKSIVRIA